MARAGCAGTTQPRRAAKLRAGTTGHWKVVGAPQAGPRGAGAADQASSQRHVDAPKCARVSAGAASLSTCWGCLFITAPCLLAGSRLKGSKMHKLYLRVALSLLQLPLVVGLLVFLPAWTFDYGQAWLFMAVFFACSLAITVYLAVRDPQLLERRMRAGPSAETEPSQKVIMVVALFSIGALPVVSAIDHRLGWSQVPLAIVILGDLLIVIAYVGFYFVFRENTYGAATIQIAEGQKVISSGPYAVVRHPMYSCGLMMLLGIPLALGSWWGLLMLIPALAALVWRLLEEERFLAKNLPGYKDYMRKTPDRLVPRLW